jgi:Cu-Zn family superoxide dismutase
MNNRKKLKFVKNITLRALGILSATCIALPSILAAQHGKHHHHMAMPHDSVKLHHSAVAVIIPTEGNETSGIVTFVETKGGVQVSGTINNLTPGKHGFHIHQYGDVRQNNGKSAGGHFNPEGKSHAGRTDEMRHIGDLGNIEADANGTATFSYLDTALSFSGETSIIGRGLIVHAGEDDLQSQPTGAAGARVGMAVIGHSNPSL